MIQFYCGLSNGENTICIDGKIRWTTCLAVQQVFHTTPYNFSYIGIPISYYFCNFLMLVSSLCLNFRIKQVTRLQDAKFLLSIISHRHVLILNSVALLCVHPGGIISKHDPYRWFVRDSAKLH